MGIMLQMDTLTFEAESVAYCVCSSFGLDTSDYSFPYIAGWSSSREMKEMKASMDVIRKTAGEMIDQLTEELEIILEEKQKTELHEKYGILVDALEAAGYRYDYRESELGHIVLAPDGTHEIVGYLQFESWRVFDSRNEISDYEIFKIPYITLSERLFGKIRNLTYRYMPNQLTLFPTETKQYDMWLLRELLNNCIAHSEYTLGGRIYLNEFEDKIILTNPGSFLPGKIEKVLDPGYNPPFYRNQLLAETMVKLNMIDSQSIGIRRVFRIQRDRYFPLPDYDLSNRQQVKVCVYGKVLDENYSQILFANPDFDLETVFLIDCVQKRIKIDKEAIKHLRKLKVIEGKSPNIFLSASVSETIGEQSQYVKNKAFNDQYYRDLIVKYLEQYGSAKKRDVRELLWDKLPEVMDDKQKESKVKNLLAQMRRTGIITTDSENQQKSSWILVKDLNK